MMIFRPTIILLLHCLRGSRAQSRYRYPHIPGIVRMLCSLDHKQVFNAVMMLNAKTCATVFAKIEKLSGLGYAPKE